LLGFGHVRREGENRASGLGAKNYGGETDEELEEVVFTICNSVAAIPSLC